MAVKYYLVDNHLTPDPTDFRAVTSPDKSKNLDDVIKVISMKNSSFSEPIVRAVINEFMSALEFWIEEGHNINTPLFNLAASISGVFMDANEDFEPGKHKLNLNLTAGTRLKALERKLRVERVEGARQLPMINQFKDVSSKTQRDMATPGQPGLIQGARLRFNEEDSKQGIFFVDSKNEVRATAIIDHSPSRVSFLIPPLAAGTYALHVRSDMGTKTIREGIAPFILTVG